ncbi:MAG: MCE family protein [Blastocatellia bacterium]|nr:MCE family protein [Blastocatellia bacterium]
MPRTNEKIIFRELRVGIFVFIGLIVFALLILNSTGDLSFFEERTRLKARFDAADGLKANAEVQLAGVPIGQVEEVKFLTGDAAVGGRIEVTLALVGELENRPITELIRTDSNAQLVATSLLANDKIINISAGTEKGAPVSENDVLTSSTSISINQLTSTGNDLLKQFNRLATPAGEILEKANAGEGTLGRIVNDERLYDSLDGAVNETRVTMTRLQATIDKINRGEGTAGKLLNDAELYNNLNRTVSQLEAISTDLRAGRGSAGKFLNDEALYADTRAAIVELRSSAQKLGAVADDIKVVTADLREGRGSIGKLLKDDGLYDDTRAALSRFNSTTARIEGILTDVQAGKGTLGKLITDETLYYNINESARNVATFTGEGTKLLDDFRKNPKKYLTIKLELF